MLLRRANVTMMKAAEFRDLDDYAIFHGLEGRLPEPAVAGSRSPIALDSYQWRSLCRGLYQTPIAA